MRNEPRTRRSSELDQNAEIKLAIHLYTFKFPVKHHLKKIGKVSNLGVLVLHTFSENSQEDGIFITTSLFSRKINYRWQNMDLLWLCQCKICRIDKDESPQLTRKAALHVRNVKLWVRLDYCGIIHFHNLNRKQTLNAGLYSQQLKRVHETFCQLCKFVHFSDNARTHLTRITREEILSLSWSVQLHPQSLFTNPSAWAGYDTKPVFKRSLTGLKPEFSFS